MGGFTKAVAGGNGNLTVKSLQSRGYAPGSQGWQLAESGGANLNNVTVQAAAAAGSTPAAPAQTVTISGGGGASAPPAPPSPPAWQPMTLSNGWRTSPTGYAQYAPLSDGYTVMVRFAGLTPGNTADGTVIWTPPDGYRTAFAGTMSFPLVVSYVTAPAGVTSTPEVVFKPGAGGMQCFSLRGAIGTLAATFTYPLN